MSENQYRIFANAVADISRCTGRINGHVCRSTTKTCDRAWVLKGIRLLQEALEDQRCAMELDIDREMKESEASLNKDRRDDCVNQTGV